MRYYVITCILVCFFISCAKDSPRKPINRVSASMDFSVSLNQFINKEEEGYFKEIMQLDSLNTYINSSKGFWYTFQKQIQDKSLPVEGDKVTYTYEVFDLNDSLIYSKDQIGILNYTIGEKKDLTEGLRNALSILKEGEMATFLFPSHKLFSFAGDQNKIGISQPLIYNIETIKINKHDETD